MSCLLRAEITLTGLLLQNVNEVGRRTEYQILLLEQLSLKHVCSWTLWHSVWTCAFGGHDRLLNGDFNFLNKDEARAIECLIREYTDTLGRVRMLNISRSLYLPSLRHAIKLY